MQPAQDRSAASVESVIIMRRGKGDSPWKMIPATVINDFTFRHLFNKVENKHGRVSPRAIRARRSLRTVPRARPCRPRRPERVEGALVGLIPVTPGERNIVATEDAPGEMRTRTTRKDPRSAAEPVEETLRP